MRTTSERTIPRPCITRRFESSRYQNVSLALAFEHAWPTSRRIVPQHPLPRTAADRSPRLRRTGS
jgi:hypothetical protein